MNDKFQRVSDLLLQLKNHKSDLIRRTIIQLISKLAKFAPEAFAADYLVTWATHLVAYTSPKKPERSVALKAIGHMAIELGAKVKPQLEKIMTIITQSFVSKPKVQPQVSAEVFECISALAQAVGTEMDIYIAPLLCTLGDDIWFPSSVPPNAKY